MRKIVAGIVFSLSFCFMQNGILCAQGFDWQYSARLPFKVPRYFAGLSAGGAYLRQSGEIRSRDYSAECAVYRSGAGPGMSAGVYGEFWSSPVTALYAGLSFQNFSSKLSSPGDVLPVRVGDEEVNVITAYEYASEQQYLTLSAGIKYRLFQTHLALGAGLDLGMLVGRSASEKERVLSPDWYSFRLPDGEHVQKREVSQNDIANMRPVFILPQIRVSYDFPLALGMYFSPTVSIGLPLMSMARDFSWLQTNYSFGISIVKSID